MAEEAPVVGQPATGEDVAEGSRTEQEVASQPACWRRAGQLAADVAGVLPAPGERVADFAKSSAAIVLRNARH